jgi:PAS domain S-box-containing protein
LDRGANEVRGPDADNRKTRVERQLATAQQLTHIGSWEWDLASGSVRWSDELYRIYGLEPQSCDITLQTFLSRVHPDDRERIQAEVGTALRRGSRFAYMERILRPDGSIRHLSTVGEADLDDRGQVLGLIGTCRDVTDERHRDEALALFTRLQDAERRVLEMIVAGADLPRVITAIVEAIEENAAPAVASVLLLDARGERVHHVAAPHLPTSYTQAIDGSAIGPSAGSCGTAAFSRKAVVVQDIEVDPRWDDYRVFARAAGFRACASTPIFGTDGRVLGTVALYFRDVRAPAPQHEQVVQRATHLAGIAIERSQIAEQLRALSARVESIREDERTGIARELHDELGQGLTALKMDLSWVRRQLGVPPGGAPADGASGRLVDKLGAMSDMTDEILGQVRKISSRLRPGVLDDLGLLAAVEWQAQEFEQRTGTTCVVESDIDDAPLDRGLSTAVFRILQEALTNVARHARARRVTVRLGVHEGVLRLEVGDDGGGITSEALRSQGSLGLLGMRERARALGGRASVGPAVPTGTLVSLEVPVTARSPEPLSRRGTV